MEPSEASLQQRTTGQRFVELDSLRGLAAFAVVWHHFWLMFQIPDRLYSLPLSSGKQGVLLFFLISGFVLSLPFWRRGDIGGYRSYLRRRFFRIYVPYVAAVFVAALGAFLFGQRQAPGVGPFFYATWREPPTIALLLRHLVMAGGLELNNAFWTLRIEIEMSLLFPALLWVLRQLGTLRGVLLSLVLLVVGGRGSIVGWPDQYFYLETVRYGAIFLLGALAAKELATLSKFWNGLPSLVRWAFFILSFALYCGYVEMLWAYLHLKWFPDVFPLSGSFGLLLCALLSKGLRRSLKTPIPEYLGRISYSLYLLHEPVLYTLAVLLAARVHVFPLAILYLFSTLSAAHCFCVLIEEPSLRLGKRFALKPVRA